MFDSGRGLDYAGAIAVLRPRLGLLLWERSIPLFNSGVLYGVRVLLLLF